MERSNEQAEEVVCSVHYFTSHFYTLWLNKHSFCQENKESKHYTWSNKQDQIPE